MSTKTIPGSPIAVAVLTFATLTTACGSSATSSVSTPAPTTIATTVPAPTTTTTTTTTTAAPTTTAVPVTADQLLSALPTLAELPAGWKVYDSKASTDFEPESGNYEGDCGKVNLDGLAQSQGAVATASTPWADVPQGGSKSRVGSASTRLYAFADAEQASKFLGAATAMYSCGIDYTVPEGTGTGQFGTSLGASGLAVGAVWNFHETMSTSPVDAPAGDQALLVKQDYTFSTTVKDKAYGSIDHYVRLLERHGRIVLVGILSGWTNLAGHTDPYFGRQPYFLQYEPSFADLLGLADLFRPGIVAKLVAAKVLPA